jgi:hypothetical protein
MQYTPTNILRFIVKPYGMVIVTTLLSFAAWLSPDFGIIWKGYYPPQKLFSFGGLVVAVWYGAIILIGWICFRLGRLSENMIGRPQNKVRLDDFAAYGFISAVGFVGFVCVVLYIIQSFSLNEVLFTIMGGEANVFHKKLYEEYSIGLFSLRYVLILGAGLAIYRILSRISHSLLDYANIIMLLLIAVIASRLSVVFALTIGFGLWILNRPDIKIKPGRWLAISFVVFIIFSFYNYSRNINFYINQGNAGFFAAGISEIVKYLAAPFQGALAAGNHFEQILIDPQHSHLYTGINPSLTTNSALLGLIRISGNKFIPIMTVSVMLASFLMGMLYRQKDNFIILIYFVLLYCFAEIWRVYIFNAGIIITLLVIAILAPAASRAVRALAGIIKFPSPIKETDSA